MARRSPGISFCLGRAHRSIQDVNRDGVNVLYDVNHLGVARFEKGFAFSPRCQERILKVCEDLRLYNTSDEYLELIKRDDELQGFCPLPHTRAHAHTCTHTFKLEARMKPNHPVFDPVGVFFWSLDPRTPTRQGPSVASSTTSREKLSKTTGHVPAMARLRRGACTPTTSLRTCRRF